jgi:phage-related tail fiber protein
MSPTEPVPDDTSATSPKTPAAAAAATQEMHQAAEGSTSSGPLAATQSAIGSATVSGDATLSASVVGSVSAKAASIRQSFAGAVMTEGDATVAQSGTPLIMAQRVDMQSGASCMVIGDEVTTRRSWVGLVASRHTTLTEGSRVIIDWKGALVLAAVMLGAAGIIVLLLWLVGRRLAHAASHLSERLPHLPHLADLPAPIRFVAGLRR